jgi:hypothetical protein
MSLLKANSVQIGQSATATQNFTLSVPSSPDGTIKLARGNSGATTADILSVSSSGAVTINNLNNQSFRNRIINGDMRIDQRNAGASYAITSALYGSCDRWGSLAAANGVWTQQRVATGSIDFPFATRVQRVAGSTSTAAGYIGQVIETANCQDLAGQTITVSYYATAGANFSAASSLIYPTIDIGTGSDQGWLTLNQGNWTAYTAISSATQVITTTRTRYSITATVPAGTNEIAVRFAAIGSGTAGANDWFQITGVQLEAGSTATEFERRPYGTELALCQRYYWTGNLPIMRNFTGGTIAVSSSIGFPVTMRATPSTVTVASGTLETAYSSSISAYSSGTASGQAYTAGVATASAEL